MFYKLGNTLFQEENIKKYMNNNTQKYICFSRISGPGFPKGSEVISVKSPFCFIFADSTLYNLSEAASNLETLDENMSSTRNVGQVWAKANILVSQNVAFFSVNFLSSTKITKDIQRLLNVGSIVDMGKNIYIKMTILNNKVESIQISIL